MNKLKLFKWIFLLIMAVVFFSCRHEPDLLPDTPTVCFQDQVLPIINSSCATSGCHDASSDEAPLTDYNNIMQFIEPGKPNQSKIYKLITTTSIIREFMPPSPQTPLTQNQINLISIWILQGAENNACIEPPCDSTNVTFSGTIFPIIQNNCLGCHSGENPEGGISLTNYNQVKASAEIPAGTPGSLWGAITHAAGNSPMPKNGNQLSDCKIAQIEMWIGDGMPNN